MRTLKTPLCVLSLLSVFLPSTQAKTNFAYVANFAANTVSVVDISSNTVVKTIPVGDGPWGVAVNQTGSTAFVRRNGTASST